MLKQDRTPPPSASVESCRRKVFGPFARGAQPLGPLSTARAGGLFLGGGASDEVETLDLSRFFQIP